MKTLKGLILSISTICVIQMSFAQGPEISFEQDGKVLEMRFSEGGYYEIFLKAEPFNILFNHKELMVTGGVDASVFKVAKAGTNISSDYTSNFFLGKFMAIPNPTDYLTLEKDTAMNLTKDKGVVMAKNGWRSIAIKRFSVEDGFTNFSDQKSAYLALWLDTNLDLFIDKAELLWVKIKFK
ncbi:MAG: hypothetical protein HKN09_12920 [Saprospiraceae bacterium]|nr:hypothetical protein [Saprospiraceae bacterium]